MDRLLTRRSVLGMAGAAALGAAAPAFAQNYPNRPIQLVVPYAAGGPTDAAARVMAQRLGERLGQPMIVQCTPGGGGVIGTDYVNRAKPDGYTLLFAVNSMAIFPYTRSPANPLPFDPNEFVPIGEVAESAHVVVTNKTSGIRSIADLVQAAKKAPNKISFGSAGVGGTTHLPLAFFAHRAGIQLLHVPYKGAAPAMVDTISGVVTVSAPGYSGQVTQSIENGSLVPLAVTSAKRLPFLPNVPTLAEASGFPDLVFPIWYGVFAPKGTPPDVAQKLTNALRDISKDPKYQKELYAQGNVTTYLPPEQFGKLLRDDIARLGDRLKAAGINLQE
jgi:tripartite-type tricarboxylate transporter receptor subunit TctC